MRMLSITYSKKRGPREAYINYIDWSDGLFVVGGSASFLIVVTQFSTLQQWLLFLSSKESSVVHPWHNDTWAHGTWNTQLRFMSHRCGINHSHEWAHKAADVPKGLKYSKLWHFKSLIWSLKWNSTQFWEHLFSQPLPITLSKTSTSKSCRTFIKDDSSSWPV